MRIILLSLAAMTGAASTSFAQEAVPRTATVAAVGNAQLEQDSLFCCQKKYFWVAAAEIMAIMVLPNYFNRHVSDDTTAVLSGTSFRRNIQRGFVWDPNGFGNNAFDHPYHGNMYFNAARSNGYDFWESSAFTFGGAFLWEMFGENTPPAINDWAATSLGGISIGESLHRAARMVRDNRARGVGRAFSELAGFLLDPVGGFNRALRGEMSRYGPTRKIGSQPAMRARPRPEFAPWHRAIRTARQSPRHTSI
jgi:hypothetical protein